LCATCAGAAHLTRQESTIVTVTWRNGFAVKGPQQPQQPVFRRQPGNDVRVNTLDILLFQSVLNPTYVNAVGWSVMDMETPGPAQSKWMRALGGLSAQMINLAIPCSAKQRNASVNRVEPLQPRLQPQAWRVQWTPMFASSSHAPGVSDTHVLTASNGAALGQRICTDAARNHVASLHRAARQLAMLSVQKELAPTQMQL